VIRYLKQKLYIYNGSWISLYLMSLKVTNWVVMKGMYWYIGDDREEFGGINR